jgi:hypothetical protein
VGGVKRAVCKVFKNFEIREIDSSKEEEKKRYDDEKKKQKNGADRWSI